MNARLKLSVLLLALMPMLAIGGVPLTNVVFQNDVNVGGHNLTNVAGVYDPSGNPITGGGSATGPFTNTANNVVISNQNNIIGANFGYFNEIDSLTGSLTLNIAGGTATAGANTMNASGFMTAGGLLTPSGFSGNNVGLTNSSATLPANTNGLVSASQSALIAAAVASANVPGIIATNGVATLYHKGTSTNFLSLESAVSNMVAGDTVIERGWLDAKAVCLMPVSSTILIEGVVSNYVDLNANGPLIQPNNDCVIGGGGSIYPGTDHSTVYHACVGFNSTISTNGQIAPTNFIVQDLNLFGDSDTIFMVQTNYFSGTIKRCLISSLTNSAWDIMVGYNTNNIGYLNFENDRFRMGPIVSALGGASLRGVNTAGILATYNFCSFESDSSIANNFCFKDSGTPTTAVASNVFNNCVFRNIGATGSTVSGTIVENNPGWDTFNNCTVIADTGGGIRVIGASTNTINNLNVSAPSFQLKLAAAAVAYYTEGNVTNVATTPANYIPVPTVLLGALIATNAPANGNYLRYTNGVIIWSAN